ncbi:hypothetical protein GIB67_005338 [Kingdonia uniflora]|uniref:Uncharacterized protein n=1 Tax=Kingdonia uniflora TaxID=39325 RepID=A0A7J7NCI8_9MAGN|nr:hypothetical protein GIB67_005338 [Kingdonia uniflora]
MSLSLIQGYTSAEEEEEIEKHRRLQPSLCSDSDSDSESDSISQTHPKLQKPSFDPPKPPPQSLLPSALDVFSEIAGPPEFLKSSVVEHVAEGDREGGEGRRRRWKEKKDLPTGAVMEAKAQLVGIPDRVRSDIDGSPASVPFQRDSTSTVTGEGKHVVSATNPDAKDAANLLRMCLQCGIPKTFVNGKGMVCIVCGDRPPMDLSAIESEKKKGSTIKDKEKNKRMKGQSSHASWKSETEMQLRQQFD